MSSSTRAHSRYVAAAVAALALALPATSAGYQDLRNPDTRGAAIETERAARDLRNPDTRGDAIESERAYINRIRSTSARSYRAEDVATPPRIVASPGFDWGDAAIGAGSVLGLLMIAASAMFGVVHRKARTATT